MADLLAHRRYSDPRRLAARMADLYEELNQTSLPELYKRLRRATESCITPYDSGVLLARLSDDVRILRSVPIELRVPRLSWELRRNHR